MSTYIIGLIGIKIWTTIFMFSFFFGLIFFAFVLLGAFGHDSDTEGELDGDASFDLDADTDMNLDIHADLDTDLDLHADIDADMHLDVHADLDTDLDMHADIDSDFHLEMDTDFDHDLPSSLDTPFESHIEFEHGGDVGIAQDSHYEEKSNYMMGNISSFMLIWGQIGWLNSNNLNDLILLYAFLGGFLTSKLFAWVIANYAKTVIVPIQYINRGDVGTVIYGIAPEKPGLVHVTRKDGVISPIIARGAFGHDVFDKGEKGYVWTKEGELYTINRSKNDISISDI
ncbi:MAG: hypothetical protein HeimC2_40820 [Candidatus Heimdallarchaeota archaeon LC_2]|nr:MAG: hypothetical protein HeimC2_40820 [Candidatus Heimdallarchaeota archaeon LC_2]